MSGKLVPWDDARIHIGSHVVHYGSAVFEGIRCYATPKGSAVFRLDAHTERLFNSAKIYWMEVPWTPEQVNAAILETMRGQQARGLLHPSGRLPRRRPAGREPPRQPRRARDHGLGLGQVPRQGSARAGRRRLRELLDAHRPEHAARHGEERGQLHELAAHQGRGGEGRLRRGHRPRRAGLRVGGQRREPVRRLEGPAPHAAPRVLGAAGHHPRQRPHPGAPRSGSRSRRRRCPARCSTSRTSSSSPAPPPRSRRSARWTARRWAPGSRGPSTAALQKAFFDVIECNVGDEHGWLTFVPALAGAAKGGAR